MVRYTCSMMCPSLKYYSNIHIHVLSCLPTLEISEGLLTPPAPHSSSIVHQAQDSVYLSCVPYLSLSCPQWSQSWLTALLQNDFLLAFLGFVPFFIFVVHPCYVVYLSEVCQSMNFYMYLDYFQITPSQFPAKITTTGPSS